MNAPGTTRVSFVRRLGDHCDGPSWMEFHQRYGGLLFGYARRCGASPQDAEDIVQDVEMSLFRAIDSFEYDPSRGRFRSYLRLAVVNAARRRASKATHQEPTLDPQILAALAQEECVQDDRWETEWRLNRLRLAFRELSNELEPVTLEAFRLHVLADRSVDETADHLRLSRASVYQAKSRVLKRLRERIDQLAAADDL